MKLLQVGYNTARLPALIIENQDEYKVEAILDKRTRHRRTEYLVKWLGYPVYEPSCELLQNLDNAKEFIIEFEKK